MSRALLGMLAETSLRASVAAGLVAGVLAALQVRASAARHASWTAVLCSMLLMPVLPYCVPAIAPPVSVSVSWLPGRARIGPLGAPHHVQRIEPSPGSDRTALAVPLAASRAEESRTVEVEASEYRSEDPNRPSPPPLWLLAALIGYSVVAAVLLMRFAVGWWGAARIARTSERIHPSPETVAVIRHRGDLRIRESRLVAAPVTVGVLAPTILLPVTWRRWPAEKLRAVLAHEIAHVHRRDPLVAFMAGLNCCLLWFHPLSWWLERTLAATAEQASDDIALATVGEPAIYAEILLDMVRAVGRGRGRLSRLGVGIDGSGLLQQRIDRVLAFEPVRVMSSRHKVVLALTCLSAILLAAACQPSSASLHENASLEQRDRTLRAELERIERWLWQDFANVDWDAGSRVVASQEAAVREHPDDLVALQQFLVSYWVQYACKAVIGCGNPLISTKAVDRQLLAERRAHILWLIDHHPESDLAGAVEARIFPQDLDNPFFPGDAIGYAQAKVRWVAHADRPDVSAAVLGHAADFLEVADKPLAEQMLRRARALDPNGPWTVRLARFYTMVLLGSNAPAGPRSLRTLSVPEPRSPYGIGVRERLGESTDEVLLTAAGWFLSHSGGRFGIHFDPEVWAESCLTRALHMNPGAILAHTTLLEVRSELKNREPLSASPPAALEARVAALPELERFEQLPRLAQIAYRTVQDISRWDDPNLQGRLELAERQAKRFAEETLTLAPKFRTHPNYGTAIYLANMTLSALALHDGQTQTAVKYLRKASAAPASEELTYSDGMVSGWHVPRDLLAHGERQAVLDFLDRMAHTNVAERLDLREAAAALRLGETPRSLQAIDRAGASAARDAPSPGTPSRATEGIRRPAFQTASVKRNTSVDWWGGPGFESPSGIFAATNMTLRTLITFAYGTPDFRISGGPSWMASDRFDVLAQTAGDVDDPFAVRPTHGPGRVQLMMQTLLAERFKLTVHQETRDQPVLALIARSDGKVGPHLRKVVADCAAFWAGGRARGGPPRAPRPGERLACIIDNEADRIASGGGTLSQMADALSMRMHRVVLDRTGLTGTFDFDLEWTPAFDPLAAGGRPGGAVAGRGSDSGSSIVMAVQEQLGLKLAAGRGPVDILRIDRAEHPVED